MVLVAVGHSRSDSGLKDAATYPAASFISVQTGTRNICETRRILGRQVVRQVAAPYSERRLDAIARILSSAAVARCVVAEGAPAAASNVGRPRTQASYCLLGEPLELAPSGDGARCDSAAATSNRLGGTSRLRPPKDKQRAPRAARPHTANSGNTWPRFPIPGDVGVLWAARV